MLIRCFIVIAFISLVIPACKSGSSKELLVGTWKLNDLANTGDSMVGTATFSKTNTLLLKTIVNGKITDTRNGSYELSADNKYLTTKIDTSTFKFEIIKLTKNILDLRPFERMNVAHYVRDEN
ncbi:MAG TPA: hypothetical protein VGQ04_20325 [Chitinophagaceae bacterium]|nr:hypothetical protein [Chitinophagaceae bacterium]